MNVQPQTGPGDAPLITPEHNAKQSAKMDGVTHVGTGVGAGSAAASADAAGAGTDLDGARPLVGPPKGVVKGRQTGIPGMRGAPGGVQRGPKFIRVVSCRMILPSHG